MRSYINFHDISTYKLYIFSTSSTRRNQGRQFPRLIFTDSKRRSTILRCKHSFVLEYLKCLVSRPRVSCFRTFSNSFAIIYIYESRAVLTNTKSDISLQPRSHVDCLDPDSFVKKGSRQSDGVCIQITSNQSSLGVKEEAVV